MMKNGLRLFGHPVHAMASHFPMALLAVAPLFDLIGLWRGEEIWWTIAFWNIAFGLIAAVPTAVSGYIDYMTSVEKGPAEKTALIHLSLMLVAVGIFGLSLLGRALPELSQQIPQLAIIGCDILGALLLGVGAWFGGELILRFGIGTQKD